MRFLWECVSRNKCNLLWWRSKRFLLNPRGRGGGTLSQQNTIRYKLATKCFSPVFGHAFHIAGKFGQIIWLTILGQQIIWPRIEPEHSCSGKNWSGNLAGKFGWRIFVGRLGLIIWPENFAGKSGWQWLGWQIKIWSEKFAGYFSQKTSPEN